MFTEKTSKTEAKMAPKSHTNRPSGRPGGSLFDFYWLLAGVNFSMVFRAAKMGAGAAPGPPGPAIGVHPGLEQNAPALGPLTRLYTKITLFHQKSIPKSCFFQEAFLDPVFLPFILILSGKI